jgi:hypothetical protein
MPVSSLLSIAGIAAAGSLAREAVSAVGSGLSFAAELARQGKGEEIAPATGERDSAQEQFTAALSQFARRLQQHLAAAGLAVTAPIELAADGLGGIDVSGNHPQQSAIEQLLATDEALREQFAALAEYDAQLTGGSRHEFGLLIEGDAAEVFHSKP